MEVDGRLEVLAEALQVLRSVRVVDFTLGPGHSKRSVTRGTHRAARILAALGITDLDPPQPLRRRLPRSRSDNRPCQP